MDNCLASIDWAPIPAFGLGRGVHLSVGAVPSANTPVAAAPERVQVADCALRSETLALKSANLVRYSSNGLQRFPAHTLKKFKWANKTDGAQTDLLRQSRILGMRHSSDCI